jgi:hypothetical protein
LYSKGVPQKIPRHAAIRARLAESVTNALELNVRLEPLIAVKNRQQAGSFHGKVDHSQPPWCAPIAYAITDLHALARRMERETRRELGLPFRVRGCSGGNTKNALDALIRLCESADDFTVRVYTRELEKWWRHAKVALDEIEVPKRLPRSPGSPEPRCPFCKNHTLRAKILQNEIWCINPSCKDGEGKKQKAHMDYSKVVGDWVVRWDDGIIMGETA